MKGVKSFILQMVLLASGLLSAPLLAADYQTGIIDGVQIKQGAIVIDDSSYRLAPNVRVHGPVSGAGVQLKKNMQIGFIVQRTGDNVRVVTEIWVLSAPPQ